MYTLCPSWKKRLSLPLPLPLSVCLNFPLSLTPSLPPSPKHPKPSLPSSPKSYRIQVVYIIEADQMYAMFLCCSCCLFLCVLLVNENIRCSKTSERNGYLGKNEGEIKKKRKEKKKEKEKDPVPSRPVRMVWPVKFPFVSKTGNMPCVWNLLVWLRKARAPHTRQYMGSFDSFGGRWHLVSSSASRVG